jgi:hypothetical protein
MVPARILRMSDMKYAELQVTTNYSFLRSGSHPWELVFQAALLGHYAIGIADRNTLAGVVRAYAAVQDFYEEQEKKGVPPVPEDKRIKLLVGSRIETIDGYSLLAYPMNLAGYKRLSRMLTQGNCRREKVEGKSECRITFKRLALYAEDILAIVLPPRNINDPDFRGKLRKLAGLFNGRCYLAATMLFRGNDAERLECISSPRTTSTITRPNAEPCTTSSPPSATNAQWPNWDSAALPRPNATSSHLRRCIISSGNILMPLRTFAGSSTTALSRSPISPISIRSDTKARRPCANWSALPKKALSGAMDPQAHLQTLRKSSAKSST